MTTQVLQFQKLEDQDRVKIGIVSQLGEGDHVELRLRSGQKDSQTVSLPRKVKEMIELLLEHLARGEKVAILTEDQELTPNEISSVLGVSRPLVVHRMDVGELPFRYVGKHRRAKLKDVLALKTRIDAQQAAIDALAEDTDELMRDHAL